MDRRPKYRSGLWLNGLLCGAVLARWIPFPYRGGGGGTIGKSVHCYHIHGQQAETESDCTRLNHAGALHVVVTDVIVHVSSHDAFCDLSRKIPTYEPTERTAEYYLNLLRFCTC